MTNPFIEALVGDAMMKTLSQEQKDKIIVEYIRTEIFSGLQFDLLAKNPARNQLTEIVKKEVEKQLLNRKAEIEQIVSEVIADEMKEKSFIKEWMHQKLLESAARKILYH